MTEVPLKLPGATKGTRLSQLYLGESVTTRLYHYVRAERVPSLQGIDLHHAILVLPHNSAARVLYEREIPVVEMHNIADVLSRILISNVFLSFFILRRKISDSLSGG